MADTYAVIMAGGSGTRFWPASRPERPKQLLPLAPGDSRSLLEATVDRIAPLVPIERVIVVTSANLADATRSVMPALPEANLLAEPVGRNTAPCVGWAAASIRRLDPDARLMVLPADHHIGDEVGYLQTLAKALAATDSGDLVTVGIKPTRPETGYGYIEVGEPLEEGVSRARRFVEKPTRERAEQLFASGSYLWNSGMFFFRVDSILSAIDEHLPGLAAGLRAIDQAAAEGTEQTTLQRTYGELPSISLDHGVMEKADRVAVVPGDFGWSDLGSWTTAWELSAKDEDGNAAGRDSVLLDARGNLVRAPLGKVVALVGVSDLVIVDTEDALLIVPRDRAQAVKEVVAALSDPLRPRTPIGTTAG